MGLRFVDTVRENQRVNGLASTPSNLCVRHRSTTETTRYRSPLAVAFIQERQPGACPAIQLARLIGAGELGKKGDRLSRLGRIVAIPLIVRILVDVSRSIVQQAVPAVATRQPVAGVNLHVQLEPK